MATPAGRHQPAQPEVRWQRRVDRSFAVSLPSRRDQLPGEDATCERLRDRVAQVSGQFTERSPGALDPAVFQRSQLRQATILRRTFLPDAARLPTAS